MADTTHRIVSHEQWIEARKELLAKEQEYTRLGDELAGRRRELPWERVTKDYVFDGPTGKETLSQLFAGRSQLAVYHFMFNPEWEEGCPHCSFWADNFNGIGIHLSHRDVTFVAISHAPLSKLEAFKRRMGWSFKWISAGENGFNYDYHVSFTPEEMAKGEIFHNYETSKQVMSEHAGASAFYKNAAGEIFHTYSSYARGLDALNGAYHWLDRMPKGRDEEGLAFSQAWVRYHDRYDTDYKVDPSSGYQPPGGMR
jgi:predicted dithiol-disulfide oxidoreductase (DUF899 family)